MSLITYCCDVGSTRAGNFGWVRASGDKDDLHVVGDDSISDCVRRLDADIRAGHVVTLGMESPLFIPVPTDVKDLSLGRDGERDRSCFAPVGAAVTTLGAHELAFIMRTLARTSLRPRLDWTGWKPDDASELLIWEAFVSGKAHTKDGDHRRDAATAATEFLAASRVGLNTKVRVLPPSEVLSVVGALLLWSGWSSDVKLLRAPTLVIKPTAAYVGAIERPSP